jgi:ABC-type nitrate/sulfonate/bicarbonate transport system ATPase subunit
VSVPVLLLAEVTREHVQGDTVVHALRGVDLAVHAGELVAVMGPSRSGESTLPHVAAVWTPRRPVRCSWKDGPSPPSPRHRWPPSAGLAQRRWGTAPGRGAMRRITGIP